MLTSLRHAFLLLWPLMLIAVGCSNHDTVDGPVAMSAYQVATFEGNGGGGAVFTFYPSGSNTLTTLTSKGETLDTEQVEPQSRVVIGYVPESGNPNASGRVALFAAMPIFTGNMQTMASDRLNRVPTESIYLEAIWPDGNWVNMRGRLPHINREGESMVLALVADESTLDADTVRMRLICQLPDGMTLADTYLRSNCYASYNVADLRRRGAKAIAIEVTNANLPHATAFTLPLLPL